MEAPTPPAHDATLRRRAVTAACMLSAFMVAIDVTIVAIAMPTIVGQLGHFELFSWVLAAYILTSAVTAPIYGRLADLYGRKHVYYVGAGLYLVGALLCGLAPSMAWLIAFRTLQGLGAGALQPLTLTILSDLYRAEERARMQAWQSAVWGVAAFVGPVLGAGMVKYVTWSAVFWINIPLGIATLVTLALVFDEKMIRREHRIDYLGAGLLMIGAGALLLALVQAQDLPRSTFLALLVGGAVVLAVLFFHERRTPEPIVPFALWRVRSVAVSNLGAFCIGAVYSCSTLFLPTYVQGVLGGGIGLASAIYAAHSIAWSVGAVIAARMLARFNFRNTSVVGSVGLFAGSVMLALADRQSDAWWLGTAASVVGIGMGICNTSFLVACQTEIGWGERGGAVSSNIFLRTIGMALGAGIGGAVVNFTLARLAPGAGDIVRQSLDPILRQALAANAVTSVSEAMAAALHDVYVMSAVFAVAALICSFALPARLHLKASG
jgi:EmrB/QacA subfamily drug resistance transporter